MVIHYTLLSVLFPSSGIVLRHIMSLYLAVVYSFSLLFENSANRKLSFLLLMGNFQVFSPPLHHSLLFVHPCTCPLMYIVRSFSKIYKSESQNVHIFKFNKQCQHCTNLQFHVWMRVAPLLRNCQIPPNLHACYFISLWHYFPYFVIISEVEHLIICLLAVWISSFVKCLLTSLAFYFEISFQTVSIPAPTLCRTLDQRCCDRGRWKFKLKTSVISAVGENQLIFQSNKYLDLSQDWETRPGRGLAPFLLAAAGKAGDAALVTSPGILYTNQGSLNPASCLTDNFKPPRPAPPSLPLRTWTGRG